MALLEKIQGLQAYKASYGLSRSGFLFQAGEIMEVILVNNGSTDKTVELSEQLLPNFPFASTVLVPVNQGYGYGILQGLEAAKGNFIGWTQAFWVNE